jgi:hypothetical protein
MTKLLLLLRTFSSDEHWNADFDYALVDLNAEGARAIADKAALVRTLKATNADIVEVTFDDALCTFYKGGAFWNDDCDLDLDEAAREHFDDFGWCILPDDHRPDDSVLEAHEARVDGVYLVIGANHVHWHATPRHASINIDSEALETRVISKLFRGP